MIIQDQDFNFETVGDEIISNLVRDKFVIALDFDGVVTNHIGLKTKYINDFGYTLREDQCSYEVCVRRMGIDSIHYKLGLIGADMGAPGVLPLEDGFLVNFDKIRAINDVVVIVLTSRFNFMLDHLREYLKYHRIRVDGIMHTLEKSKTDYLKKINAHMFIDDSPHKLKRVLDDDMGLFNRTDFILFRNLENNPENNPHEDIIEIDNWDGLFEIISEKYKDFLAKADI
jgi:hypothetical protein